MYFKVEMAGRTEGDVFVDLWGRATHLHRSTDQALTPELGPVTSNVWALLQKPEALQDKPALLPSIPQHSVHPRDLNVPNIRAVL